MFDNCWFIILLSCFYILICKSFQLSVFNSQLKGHVLEATHAVARVAANGDQFHGAAHAPELKGVVDAAARGEGPEVGAHIEHLVGRVARRVVVAAGLHGEAAAVVARVYPVGRRHQFFGIVVGHHFRRLVVGGKVPALGARPLKGVPARGIVPGGRIVRIEVTVRFQVGTRILAQVGYARSVSVKLGAQVALQPAVVDQADHLVGVAAAVLRMHRVAHRLQHGNVARESGRGVRDGGDPHHGRGLPCRVVVGIGGRPHWGEHTAGTEKVGGDYPGRVQRHRHIVLAGKRGDSRVKDGVETIDQQFHDAVAAELGGAVGQRLDSRRRAETRIVVIDKVDGGVLRVFRQMDAQLEMRDAVVPVIVALVRVVFHQQRVNGIGCRRKGEAVPVVGVALAAVVLILMDEDIALLYAWGR